jgi:murein DD-endopeptidase MepM/ murein hydrolase activator NlpD
MVSLINFVSSVSVSEKIRQFIDQLREKHKLTFINDTTYHEKWSFTVSSLTLISLLIAYTIFIVIILMVLFRFTTLKSVVQSGDTIETRAQIEEQQRAIDSLYSLTTSNEKYLDNLMRLLNDEDFNDSSAMKSHDTNYVNYVPNFTKSREDSILRAKMQNQEVNGVASDNGFSIDFFFPPVNGLVSQSFNINKEHFGVDVSTTADEPIKACLNGTVILAGWVPGEGNIIVIQHSNEFTSIYKHCSVLLKAQGDRVAIGDPIGIVGNTGENTSGPHLHFELWQNGVAMNPQEFISF